MPWVKLDDGFPFHRKAILAGKDGRALYITALCWTSGQLTDGFVDSAAVPMLAAISDVANAEATVKQLASVGLWELADGGYQIHDYHDYNPSSDRVKEIRKERAEAGRRGGIASGESRREANDGANDGANQELKRTPFPFPSPSPIPIQETPLRAFFDELSTAWHNYYPDKRQYGYDTVKDKIAARHKNAGFREHWAEALRMSCNVKALRDESWFSFEYLIRNNTNYLKLLDGTFAFKDGDKRTDAPRQAKPVDGMDATAFFKGAG